MSIMKIVYTQEKCELRGDGISAPYMGEESWQIGEYFGNEFLFGVVSDITGNYDDGYYIWVTTKNEQEVQALWIALHSVQRVYFGKEE